MKITKTIKRIVSFLIFFVMSSCGTASNLIEAGIKSHARIHDMPTVTLNSVTFDNKTWFLLKFNSALHDSATTNNLKATIGDNITLNGESCATSFNYVGPWQNNFFDCIYMQPMDAKIVSTTTYLNPTIHIKSGTHFCNAVLPEVTLEYINDAWTISSNVAIATGFNTWNHNIQSGYSHSLLSFNINLFDANMSAIDFKDSIGPYMTLNGEDINTAAHFVGSWGGGNFLNCLHISIPMTKLNAQVNQLVINSGAIVNGKTLKETSFTLINDKWEQDTINNYCTVSYKKFNTWNNYLAGNQTHNLISFSKSMHNQSGAVNFASALGGKVTINDVPLTTINGYFGTYPGAFFDCVYVYFPTSSLTTDAYHPYPTLHIEAGVCFFDDVLPELTFHLYHDKWVRCEEPTTSLYRVNPYNNNVAGVGDYASRPTKTTIIEFNNDVGGGDANLTLLENAYDIGYGITINDIPFASIEADEPNNTAIWYNPGFNTQHGLTLNIPTSYLLPHNGYEYTTLEIKKGTPFMNAFLDHTILYLVNDVWTDVSPYGVIRTELSASIRETNGNVNGMSFETRIDYDSYNTIKNTYSNIEMGTFIIDKNSYLSSGYSSISDYIANVSPSSTTYVDIRNDYNDFLNPNSASSQGYYAFRGSLINIKNTNICRSFIPVGYIKYNGNYEFGQSGRYSISLYEVLKDAYIHGDTRGASLLQMVPEFIYSPSKGLMEKDTTISNSHTISRSEKDSHTLTAVNTPIYGVVVNGVMKRTNISIGATKYINNSHQTFTIEDQHNGINYGIAEPNNELWFDTNSNTDYNNMNVVSSLVGKFNAKSARIWVPVNKLLSTPAWEDSGFIYPGPDFSLDPTDVSILRQTIQAYRSNGVTEIIVLCQGFVRTFNEHIYYSQANNTFYTVNEYSAIPDADKPSVASMMHVLPQLGTSEYESFLANQQEFYRLFAEEFKDEVDAIETQNEINLNGSTITMEYYLNNKTYTTSEFASIINQVQKPVYDGIHSVTDNIRVLTPAFSCIGNTETNPTYARDIRDLLPAIYNSLELASENPDDYFDAINLHPYLYPSKDTAANCDLYLYTTTPRGRTGSIDNTNYVDDWEAYLDNLYSTCVSHGDSEKQFYFTEYGYTDLGIGTSNVTTDGNWKNFNKNNILNTIITNMNAKMQTKSYIRTVLFFRLLDFTPSNFSMAGTTEPNFGVINEDLTLKNTGKAIYQAMNNGSTNYTEVENYLATLRGS